MSHSHERYDARPRTGRQGLSPHELIQLHRLLDDYLRHRRATYVEWSTPMSVEQLRAEIAAAAGVAR